MKALMAIAALLFLCGWLENDETIWDKEPLYSLTLDYMGNEYILDHDMSLSDCTDAMHGRARYGCVLQR